VGLGAQLDGNLTAATGIETAIILLEVDKITLQKSGSSHCVGLTGLVLVPSSTLKTDSVFSVL
jgi:hypothetical protein